MKKEKRKLNPEWVALGPQADVVFQKVQVPIMCQGTPVAVFNIPSEVFDAAMKVSRWFNERGIEHWELLDLCSRNHAFELASVKGGELYMAKCKGKGKKCK